MCARVFQREREEMGNFELFCFYQLINYEDKVNESQRNLEEATTLGRENKIKIDNLSIFVTILFSC